MLSVLFGLLVVQLSTGIASAAQVVFGVEELLWSKLRDGPDCVVNVLNFCANLSSLGCVGTFLSFSVCALILRAACGARHPSRQRVVDSVSAIRAGIVVQQ